VTITSIIRLLSKYGGLVTGYSGSRIAQSNCNGMKKINLLSIGIICAIDIEQLL